MNIPPQLQKIFQDASQRINNSNLSLNDAGVCCLDLPDGRKLVLEWEEQRSMLWIYTLLAPVPEDAGIRAVLYERMLALNLLLVGTEGGVLSLHVGAGSLAYQTGFPLEGMTGELLVLAVTRLLEKAELVRQRLLLPAPHITAASASA